MSNKITLKFSIDDVTLTHDVDLTPYLNTYIIDRDELMRYLTSDFLRNVMFNYAVPEIDYMIQHAEELEDEGFIIFPEGV